MPPLAIRALAHLPFYEALAVLDESSDDWRALSAGLLALRLFDRWSDEERTHDRPSRWEISGVAEAVTALPATTPVRSILGSLVSAAADRQAPAAALPMLSAYARALQYDARWPIAADVYERVVSFAGADADLALSAAYQRGNCLRMAGDLDAALDAYNIGRVLAVRAGSLLGMLQSDLGIAAVAARRGNLPAAQQALDAIIESASPADAGCTIVLSSALHDRGAVAVRRHRYDEAIGYLDRALRLCERPSERERILGDIAAALVHSGQYAIARDAHLVVYATARSQDTRWVAALNLLELSAWTDNEPSFEHYRRELAGEALPPALRAHYHLYVADGLQRFGRPDDARADFERALAMAEQHEVNDVRFEAERRLAQLARSAAAPSIAQTNAASEQALEAARTISALREELLTAS